MIENKLDKYLKESTVDSKTRGRLSPVWGNIIESIEELEGIISTSRRTMNPKIIDIMESALKSLQEARRQVDKLI